MPTRTIPVVALTGFLGSGKTTLMNHILEHNHGLRIGVVVNDYGDINIDSQLIQEQTDASLELTNGCICCSMDSLELDEAIGQFAYDGSPIDYIIIEASGLAEPADLARTLHSAMTPQTRLDSIIAVIDAANWQSHRSTHTMVTQQIEHSDFVVINKTDLIQPEQLTQIKQAIVSLNSRARLLSATRAAIDVRLLFDPDATTTTTSTTPTTNNHAGHSHLHEHYMSLSFTSDRPLDPLAFQAFVNHQIPATVYRAKGIIDLGAKGHNRQYRFQLVGKRAELTWAEWDKQPPRTELVCIGQDIDAPALRCLMAACIDPAPTTANPTQRVTLPRHRP
jgi:G3E family GTPase